MKLRPIKKEILSKISVIDEVFQNLKNNIEVLDFIVIDLFPEKFDYTNNAFLLWLWKSTMSAQLISFYHLLHPKEKHSLQNLYNSLLNSGVKIDYKKLDAKLTEVTASYTEKKFEVVRSRYIAHKDIDPEKIETDMRSVVNLTKSLIDIYNFLRTELNLNGKEFENNVKLDLKKIFSEINEYKNLKVYMEFERERGRTNFAFEDMIKMSTL